MSARRFVLPALGAAIVAACGAEADVPPAPSPPPAAPSAGFAAPIVPKVGHLDRDGDRIDDRILRTKLPLLLDRPLGVEAIFDAPIGQPELDAFVAAGGTIRHVFRAVSYGFTGTIPRTALAAAARALGPHLLLLEGDRPARLHLDEATAAGRARPVWAAGFAGNPGGYSGAGVTIGILDTGVDGTHPDLAGRMAGWKDYTADAAAQPIDRRGHGSHVAGIALGSGAAFGVGPGTLHVTASDDLSTLASGSFERHPFHVPGAATFDVTATASWSGGGAANLDLLVEDDGAIDAYTVASGPASGASPLTHAFSVTAAASRHYAVGLLQNAGKSIGQSVVSAAVSGYPAAGDGQAAFRGVAAKASWFGAKVFQTTGDATTADIAAAMDDMVVLRQAQAIKVVNLSFSVGVGDSDVTQRTKANTMVENGIVVVASAGNGGPDIGSGDPGRAGNVITVGATNDQGALTAYSSRGSSEVGSDEDLKPDVVAPGGSLYTSQILSVDSNTGDGADGSLPDAVPNDYTPIMGTSMAAPFVAGSAALVIEALGRSGAAWSFAGSASPFLVKALLLASSTETAQDREDHNGNPALGRSAAPKDDLEGYGLVNPDAAIEAATVDYADFSGATSGSPSDRRAWGRRIALPAGKTVRFVLATPPAADLDLYLFDGTPGAKGNPVLLAASDHPGAGVADKLSYTVTRDGTAWFFVKRVSGSGTFTVESEIFTCGDGQIEPGEECDDGALGTHGAQGGSDCCSATCQLVPDGTACNDESVCTKDDTCQAGKCGGSTAISCFGPDECHVGVCDPASGACSVAAARDGTPCSVGVCTTGVCGRVAGNGLGGDLDLEPASAGYTVGGGGCSSSARGGCGSVIWIGLALPVLRLARRRKRSA